MRLTAKTLVCAVVCVAPACGGQLYVPASDLQGDRDTPNQECSPLNPDGECPGTLLCCNGVCDESCEQWLCNCDRDQACVSGVCTDITDENECSPTRTDGLCPMQQVCIQGICVPIGGVCGCPAEQACVDGECIDIPPDQHCSPQNLTGLCEDGKLCLGGECVPINNACSETNCTGLCPAGATCVGCRCVPIDDRPCGPDALDGLCPNCQKCVSPGVCEHVLCGPDAPACGCSEFGDYCNNGICECLPCNPGFLLGCCDEDEFCSGAGLCLPEGKCAVRTDCRDAGTFCTCNGNCVYEGICECDVDCGQYYRCDNNTCVRDDACPNGDGDCPSSEFCDSTQHCRLRGTCGALADCDDQPGTFCSVCGECIATATCCRDDDCNVGVGEYCSTASTCLVYPDCASSFDCPPGEICDPDTHECSSGGGPCTANGAASCVDAAGLTFWCCPTGNADDCCPQGQRCHITDDCDPPSECSCIPVDSCRDDSDCLAGYFTCNIGTFACEPVTVCSGETCGAGQHCSVAGGCIPEANCVAAGDCPVGEVCNALFACEPAAGCGDQEFEASKVPPNMLVVFDRSGSMNSCIADDTGEVQVPCDGNSSTCGSIPACAWTGSDCDEVCTAITSSTPCRAVAGCRWRTQYPRCYRDVFTRTGLTRWETALSATSQVVTAYSSDIRFGLSLFPYPCVGSCDYECDYSYCDSCGATAGGVDVAVGEGTAASIISALNATFPGGSTPTAPTLRAVEADRSSFGLPNAADPVQRANYVLLVTDGDANNSGTDAACSLDLDGDGDTEDVDLVDCALDRLRQATPPVRTFVVGFAFSGSTSNLDCNAYYGGTARQDICPGVTEVTCDNNGVGPCYYPADNEEQLLAALSNIASSVASCSYALDPTPPDPDRLYVYFYNQCVGTTPEATCNAKPGCLWSGGACVGNPVRLPRDRNRIDNWDYDPISNQVIFAGNACADLEDGGITPVVIMGCCGVEGC